jgi:hypothetical protein
MGGHLADDIGILGDASGAGMLNIMIEQAIDLIMRKELDAIVGADPPRVQ